MSRMFRSVLVLSVVALAAGCHPVSAEQFQTHKTGVHASGKALDDWVAKAAPLIEWMSTRVSKLCKNEKPEVCGPDDPPAAPPAPPPGEWGM